MSNSINPLEWILPPVALTHMAVDTAAKAITGKPAVVAPGSALDKQRKAAQAQQAQQETAQRLNESRARNEPRPFTEEETLASRRRALQASEFITGRRRTRDTLAETGVL